VSPILKGKAIRIGDHINTDLVISGRYKFAITDMKKLSCHLFEDLDPHFGKKVKPGKTILVAGDNFGMGSSREQAPLVIKEAGILAVVAKSFARIFYRNAFNIGLPLIETDTDFIRDGDLMQIDLGKGTLKDITRGQEFILKPLPKILQELLKAGGVVPYLKKHGGLTL
jgi:3-isopropylmalate/(R)-2-methylmalate dehydratase small subunit